MTNLFKHIIRDSYRGIREAIPEASQNSNSLKICARIQSMEKYRYARRIALYHAVNGETDLNTLWQTAPKQGRFCYFPVLKENKTLAFLPATPATSFITNRFGILEPQVDLSLAIPIQDLDIIFIPLVAFDKNCTRIGMGGGYYDRTLSHNTPSILIGAAFEFQRHPWIEPDSWDIPLTAVVTEKTIYWRDQVL